MSDCTQEHVYLVVVGEEKFHMGLDAEVDTVREMREQEAQGRRPSVLAKHGGYGGETCMSESLFLSQYARTKLPADTWSIGQTRQGKVKAAKALGIAAAETVGVIDERVQDQQAAIETRKIAIQAACTMLASSSGWSIPDHKLKAAFDMARKIEIYINEGRVLPPGMLPDMPHPHS
jgi:hypothetical protein